MTKAEFLSIFEKHLHVGGIKRAEIMREIGSHLTDAGSLQNPSQIAQKINRIHLGWICSENRIAILVSAIPLLKALMVFFEPQLRTFVTEDVGFVMFFYLWFGLPIILALWLGRTIAHWHQAASVLRKAWVMVILVSMAGGLWKDWLTGIERFDVPDTVPGLLFSAFLTAALVSGFAVAFVMVGVFLRSDSPLHRPEEKLRHTKLQLALASSTLLAITAWLGQIQTLVGIGQTLLIHAPTIMIVGYLIWYIIRKVLVLRQELVRATGI